MHWNEEFPGFMSVLSSLKYAPFNTETNPYSKYWANGNPKVCGIVIHVVQNGHIKRLTDPDIELPVIEICGTNIMKNYMALPANPGHSLKIKMPILVLLVKNVKII